MCNFNLVFAEDFINHIETKHQKKADYREYTCDRCDYVGRSEEQFKKHLEVAHDLNVGGFTKVSNSNAKKLCINWNRGHCTFDNKCRFEHKEMPPCMYV